jgi:hypothetical protein
VKPGHTLRGFAAAAAVVASQALTLAAFTLAGRPWGMTAAGACAVLWLGALARAVPAAGACLFASVALAALSILAGGPGWLGVAASCASVVAWDLTRFASGGAPAVDRAGEQRLVRSRLGALAAGLLPGLVLAALFGQLRLTVPFPVMLGVGILALLALDRAARRWGREG